MPPHVETDSDVLSSMNVLHIRAMVLTDIPTVVEIDRLTWDCYSWPIEDFVKAYTDSTYYCWILEEKTTNNNSSILGYGFQYIIYNHSHIANLCIHPEKRHRGLGGILLRHMIEQARNFSVSTVILEVNIANLNAYKLYVKHGFTIIEYLDKYYLDMSDAYRMHLYLH